MQIMIFLLPPLTWKVEEKDEQVGNGEVCIQIQIYKLNWVKKNKLLSMPIKPLL